MPVEQFENNYTTQLNGAIDSDDTTIIVDSGPNDMSGQFRIRIGTELILVGTVSGSTFSGCTRGIEGTAAASHSDNAVVEHILTADSLKLVNNYVTTTAPTVNDDTNDGFVVGSRWILSSSPRYVEYIATDVTAGAAVWKRLSDWDLQIIKASDQGVTNSAVHVDDTELQFAVSSGDIWEFDLICLYTSDTTGDFNWRINTPGVDMSIRNDTGENSANAVHDTPVRDAGVSTLSARAAGGGTITIVRHAAGRGWVTLNAGGTFAVQFAQNTQTAGQTATMKAGSTLKARRLYPL